MTRKRPILAFLAGAAAWSAVVIPLALLLSGCEPAKNVGADGYEFEKAEWQSRSFQVEIVPYTSVAEFRRTAARVGARSEDGGEVRAFSEIVPGKQCRIHIMDPLITYEPEWIGHELTHCAYGRWHQPGKSGAA